MATKRAVTRKARTEFFKKVYGPNSIAGGILQASRPNNSVEWDADEDARRIKKNALSFAREHDKATEILAKRRA